MGFRAVITEPERRSPEPIEESTEKEEMAETTNRLPAPRPLLEAAASAFLLLRSTNRESGIEVLVLVQELLILRIEG